MCKEYLKVEQADPFAKTWSNLKRICITNTNWILAWTRILPNFPNLFSLQNLKNQIMTTNVWVEQVSGTFLFLLNFILATF